MMQLSRARFARSHTWLEWEAKNNGIFLRIPEDRLSLHVLFFIHQGLSFKHLITGMNVSSQKVAFPEGVNNESNVMDFLNDEKNAKAVEFTFNNGEKRFLRNRACDGDVKLIKEIMESPQSLYGHMKKYKADLEPNPSFREYSGQINFFLNHFYMRLAAKTYCKIKQIPLSSPLTPIMKAEILNYIGEEYKNHSPASIKKIESERDNVEQKILKTKQEIELLEKQIDKKINLYKFGAIAVTAGHIISFGYMIFFVDWLGWDIIEPLTYSVGVFYTLLGIRFYRKYRTDRTNDTIKETLLKIVINPTKMVALKDLKNQLAMQEKELQRVNLRATLLKNRINFRTSLVDSFSEENSLLTSR